jgi:ribosomal protein S18 acetylase RimI-like enzyme
MRAMPATEVRIAAAADMPAVGRLLDAFNREYDDPTRGPELLARRIGALVAAGDSAVVLVGAGDDPDGFALLRFRPAYWSDAQECYLAELYVVPERRGYGLGRALMERALDLARERGADYISLGTSEADRAAVALYERLGFVNREHPPDGPVMYVYERDL